MPLLAGQLKVPGGHGGRWSTSQATPLTFPESVTVTGAGGFLPPEVMP